MLLSIGYMTVWLLWYILMNWNFGNIFLPFHFTFFYPHLPSPHLLHMSVCLSVSVIIRFYVFIIELLFCCFALVVLFVSSYFTLFHSIHFSLFLFWFRLFFFQGGGGMLVFCRTGGYHFWLYWVGLLLFPIHVRLNTSLTAMICLW